MKFSRPTTKVSTIDLLSTMDYSSSSQFSTVSRPQADDRESTRLSLQLSTQKRGKPCVKEEKSFLLFRSGSIDFFPLKPRKESKSSPIVFHDFLSLMGPLSSLKTHLLDAQEPIKGSLQLSLSLSLPGSGSGSGSCSCLDNNHLKRKSTTEMEGASAGRRGKRARTQINELTELRMGFTEPWTIRKTLERSDVNNLARLMLPKDAAEKHIMAYWDQETVKRAKSKDHQGVTVTIYDRDTNVEKTLKLKQWGKGSPILNDRWVPKFVHRRNLQEGDEIGLYWDQPNSRLVFSLIAKARPSSSTASTSTSVITFTSPN